MVLTTCLSPQLVAMQHLASSSFKHRLTLYISHF